MENWQNEIKVWGFSNQESGRKVWRWVFRMLFPWQLGWASVSACSFNKARHGHGSVTRYAVTILPAMSHNLTVRDVTYSAFRGFIVWPFDPRWNPCTRFKAFTMHITHGHTVPPWRHCGSTYGFLYTCIVPGSCPKIRCFCWASSTIPKG